MKASLFFYAVIARSVWLTWGPERASSWSLGAAWAL